MCMCYVQLTCTSIAYQSWHGHVFSFIFISKMSARIEDPAVSNFRNYLRIKSVHPEPDYDGCVKFLKEMASEIGLTFDVLEVHPGKPVVVLGWPGSEPKLPCLLLNSHMDVVPVFPEHWKYDPFSAHKDEQGNIYARGAQDMKCVGIQYLEAIRILKLKKGCSFRRNIYLTFVPEEETSGELGMAKYVETDHFVNLNVGFALDEGLASENEVYRFYQGERNPWWVKVVCTGNPGHGSKFIENTAAEKLHKVIGKFLAFREEQRQLLASRPDWTIGNVITVNMTKVAGGVQMNVVPSELSASFDIRLPPTVDFEAFEAMINVWLEEIGPGIHVEYLVKTCVKDVTDTTSSNPWWNCISDVIAKLSMPHRVEIFTGATDSRFLRERGIPAIGFSPMIHTPILLHDHNEFLNEQVFLRGIDIYVELIPALANCQ